MATSFSKVTAGLFTLLQARWLNLIFAEVATSQDLLFDGDGAADAVYTIGAEGTNTINVAVVLNDVSGSRIAAAQGVQVFLSDAATGIGLTATAPDGGWAIGTDGEVLNATVAGKLSLVQSEVDGTFDITITESGTATFYMVVILPNGKQDVSAAITFAA